MRTSLTAYPATAIYDLDSEFYLLMSGLYKAPVADLSWRGISRGQSQTILSLQGSTIQVGNSAHLTKMPTLKRLIVTMTNNLLSSRMLYAPSYEYLCNDLGVSQPAHLVKAVTLMFPRDDALTMFVHWSKSPSSIYLNVLQSNCMLYVR